MHFDLPSTEKYLDEFQNFERRPNKNMLNLHTMDILCTYFGHPERACPCFHVAGSKGKGTIAGNIAAILRAKGYSTGVYASPHVYHFTERISTGKNAFDKNIYKRAEQELKSGISTLISDKKIQKEYLTWFELATIFAMLVFREAGVDYAVYEVGMGGRLDTTNIIQPLAIAMGPIELEHTKFLGNTLTKIATEKAGVFKPNIPVISAPQDTEVQAIFKEQAAKNHATVEYVEETDYQMVDARVAFKCVQKAFPDLDEKTAISVALGTALPGRYELIKNYHGLPYLLLDGAHTENSIKKVLERMAKDHIHSNLIFACAADKNVEKMATEILESGSFTAIYLTRPGDFKKSDFPRTIKAFENCPVPIYADPDYQALIRKALEDSKRTKTPLTALGSFYLPEQIKKVS